MSGLKRNFLELRDCIESFALVPFSFLPIDRQKEVAQNLSKIFSGILSRLEKENLGKTKFFEQLKMLQSSIENDVIDEQKFTLYLKHFLILLNEGNEGTSLKEVNEVAQKFFKRIEPFNISELQARKYREAHTSDQVFSHDFEIINKTLQVYALDYFLFSYKNLISAIDKKSLIFGGMEKAPALATDALDDDMLKKVVYSLCGKDIRKRMIFDYFTYKKVFILTSNENNITEEKVSEIVEKLRVYCLSLLDISLELGIASFKYSLLEPYGNNADLTEIKKQILDGQR